MKISGLPSKKNMVMVFDPDEIEKVSLYFKECCLIPVTILKQETWSENKFTALCYIHFFF
jgi:hypothetical protein